MHALALFIAISATPSAPAGDTFDPKTELVKWQGTWEVELQLIDGKEAPAKDRRIAKVVIKDDVWAVYFKDVADPVKGKIKLGRDGKLNTIDVIIGTAIVKAVYLLDGDRVLIAAGDVNGERPKDFSTSSGFKSGGLLLYKRVSK